MLIGLGRPSTFRLPPSRPSVRSSKGRCCLFAEDIFPQVSAQSPVCSSKEFRRRRGFVGLCGCLRSACCRKVGVVSGATRQVHRMLSSLFRELWILSLLTPQRASRLSVFSSRDECSDLLRILFKVGLHATANIDATDILSEGT